MDEDYNDVNEVYNKYLELSKPTKEDLEKVFTEEELKELCLKHKSNVLMYRWNVVNDYRIVFKESGRFQKWSERERLRMLAKAVNRMKPSVLYTDEEIMKVRKEEWGIQLKDNILSLKYWRRKENNTRLEATESDHIDREVQSQCEINTESMNSDLKLQVEQDAESMNSLEEVAQHPHKQTEYLEIEVITESMNHEENLLVADIEAYYFNESNSSDSELHNEQQEQQVDKVLNSQETSSDLESIYNINTMSMTIDSEVLTPSLDLQMQQSQDVISQNYENFKNIIPLTSTQSQSQASENVIS